jgi:DNA-binding beta-propeller fold protein YncE
MDLRRVASLAALLAAWGTNSLLPATPSPAWVISANEGKLDLVTGAQRMVPNPVPDSLTLLDFASFPPGVRHLTNVPNTVLGPPSNVAFTPDRRHVAIANSIVPDPSRTNGWRPGRAIHLLDLAASPPTIATFEGQGLQPSGLCFNPSGHHLLAANRADGSVSLLRLDHGRLVPVQSLSIVDPAVEVADVAVSPDDRFVVASLTKTNQLALLRKEGERLSDTGRRISTYGKPYRVMFTPDGRFVLTAGAGNGNGLDIDALTVVRRQGDDFLATGHVPLAAGPESFDISPDGQWGAAVLMNGSNTGSQSPNYRDHGLLVMFRRRGDQWTREQTLPTGAIPEGVVITPDGRHVVVQCHPDRELRIYRRSGARLRELPSRIPVPGMPSGMGAAR